MAKVYQEGKHVAADRVRAYAWMTLAETSGNALAAKEVNMVSFDMSLDQIRRGMAAAQQWRIGADIVVAVPPVGGMAVGQFNLNAPFAPGR